MAAERPNVVLIITDHHAWYRHQRPGEFQLRLPAYERLCTEGVRFDRAYAVCPLCSPARASMMTGLFPSTHGLRWNTEATWLSENRSDFRPGTRLYSHYLAPRGYRNVYVGKWHCGHERLPADFGVEGWSLPDYGKVYMSDAYRDYARRLGLADPQARIEHNLNHPEWAGRTLTLADPSPWTFMNGSGVLLGPPEAHEEQFVAGLAVDELRDLSRGGQPFSLVVSFWGPHQPYFPTEPFAGAIDPKSIPEYPSFNDDYSGNKPLRHFVHRDLVHGGPRRLWPEWSTWQEVLARAYEQQLQLDDAVGRVLRALDETGLAENTLVIYVADHGDAVASHGGLWDKGSTYTEEVARVPLVVRWPGRAPAGAATSALVSNMDVTATMIEAAGAAVPEGMHSRSLLPLLENPATSTVSPSPTPLPVGEGKGEGRRLGEGKGEGGRVGRPAGTRDHVIAEHNGHGDNLLQRIVVTERYKYVACLWDKDELYDLTEDPYELRNLIDAPAAAPVARDLRALLIDHIERTNDRPARYRLLYALKMGM